MTEYEKPEGTLCRSRRGTETTTGASVAEMETLQKRGGDPDSDE